LLDHKSRGELENNQEKHPINIHDITRLLSSGSSHHGQGGRYTRTPSGSRPKVITRTISCLLCFAFYNMYIHRWTSTLKIISAISDIRHSGVNDTEENFCLRKSLIPILSLFRYLNYVCNIGQSDIR
jgi:hypothetical protein